MMPALLVSYNYVNNCGATQLADQPGMYQLRTGWDLEFFNLRMSLKNTRITGGKIKYSDK
jgi:hypothetical protein